MAFFCTWRLTSCDRLLKAGPRCVRRFSLRSSEARDAERREMAGVTSLMALRARLSRRTPGFRESTRSTRVLSRLVSGGSDMARTQLCG